MGSQYHTSGVGMVGNLIRWVVSDHPPTTGLVQRVQPNTDRLGLFYSLCFLALETVAMHVLEGQKVFLWNRIYDIS